MSCSKIKAKLNTTYGLERATDCMNIHVYVNNLLIAARKPEEIISKLQEEHKFTLKGVGPLT